MSDKSDFILNELIRLRKKLGYTQQELGIHLNIHESSYRKIEQGKTVLSLPRFFQLCDFFKVSPIQLFEGLEMYEDFEVIRADFMRLKSNETYLREENRFLKEKVDQLINLLEKKGE
jgi:transcriptional regulator with XRE-family HTH domain